jgi:cytoskeletal protein RodZ
VGETLQAARERKGVDLYRAERDTKIRLRYLSALEDADYDELPAPVYVKGFLRNYAIYLGLDPEEILDRWHDEMESLRTATRVAVAPPPMPLVEPGGRRLTITPGMFVAGLVVLVILAFFGFIGLQLLRFVQAPTPVVLTYPDDRVSTVDAQVITLEGTSGRGSIVTIRGSGDAVYPTTANEEGEWFREVNLARGTNNFTIVARDPVTGRDSDPLAITVNVPLPDAPSPGVSPTPSAPVVPLTMTLDEPLADAVITGPGVTFSGDTTGSRITIASVFVAEVAATPSPSASPDATSSPGPSRSPSATTAPIGPARDVTLTAPGPFSETLTFEPGIWRVTVTAYATGQAAVLQTFDITVEPPPPTDVTLVITMVGESWVRVVSDGERAPGYGGRQLDAGETHTVHADTEMCLRAANAGGLSLNLNGLDLGVLGAEGEAGSWTVRAGQTPLPAPTPCE